MSIEVKSVVSLNLTKNPEEINEFMEVDEK